MLSTKLASSQFRWLIACGVFAGTLAFAPELLAQEAAEEMEGAGGSTLLDKIISGGWFMIPIGILSLAMITLYVFNGLQLMKSKYIPKNLYHQVLDLMSQVRVRSAIESAAASNSFYGRMMATALPHVDATDPDTLGREAVEDAIADFTVKENANQMVWIQYLSVVAQMAPMMGLMGTVWGMVNAFETLGVGKGSDPSKLAGDISIALMTTLGGLVVALPAIFGYYLFRNALQGNVREAHRAAAESIDAAIAAVNAEQQMARVPEGLAEG